MDYNKVVQRVESLRTSFSSGYDFTSGGYSNYVDVRSSTSFHTNYLRPFFHPVEEDYIRGIIVGNRQVTVPHLIETAMDYMDDLCSFVVSDVLAPSFDWVTVTEETEETYEAVEKPLREFLSISSFTSALKEALTYGFAYSYGFMVLDRNSDGRGYFFRNVGNFNSTYHNLSSDGRCQALTFVELMSHESLRERYGKRVPGGKSGDLYSLMSLTHLYEYRDGKTYHHVYLEGHTKLIVSEVLPYRAFFSVYPEGRMNRYGFSIGHRSYPLLRKMVNLELSNSSALNFASNPISKASATLDIFDGTKVLKPGTAIPLNILAQDNFDFVENKNMPFISQSYSHSTDRLDLRLKMLFKQDVVEIYKKERQSAYEISRRELGRLQILSGYIDNILRTCVEDCIVSSFIILKDNGVIADEFNDIGITSPILKYSRFKEVNMLKGAMEVIMPLLQLDQKSLEYLDIPSTIRKVAVGHDSSVILRDTDEAEGRIEEKERQVQAEIDYEQETERIRAKRGLPSDEEEVLPEGEGNEDNLA